MYTATTNLIAAAQQHDKSTTDNKRTTTTLLTGLKLSILVGTIFAIILSLSAKTLIQTLIGNEYLDPSVMEAALRYVRIRSLGMPAALVIGTAQSACLGMQDVKSPLLVLMAAAAINFLGDVFLVGKSNLWLGGAAGAAWATIFSQYGALYMFWRWFVHPLKKKKEQDEIVDVSKGILELTGTCEEGQSRRHRFRKFLTSMTMKETDNNTNLSMKEETGATKARGFLTGKLKLREFFHPSNFDTSTAKEYLPFVIPVTTTSVGRISGYIAMSHVASSTLGTFDMAAHQIIFSIFCCLTPIVDGLSQVAQSFVPGVFEHEQSQERALALSKTIMNFRKVGAAFGGVLISLVACIPLISRYFTTDAMVLNRVNGALPGVALFLLVNGLMCAGEGSLLGQKDLHFLRNMYTVFFFTVPAWMLRLKHRSLLGIQEVSIGTMWAAFSMYNVIRTCIWHLRLAQLQRRTNRVALEEIS
jgi:Na+-driven multidrug efflux pump